MSKLRKSAKGMPCFVRIPNICNFNSETVVLAHLRGKNTGIGLKRNDLQGAFCCYACHQVVDGAKSPYSKDLIELWHRQGVERTQEYWLSIGLIKIN